MLRERLLQRASVPSGAARPSTVSTERPSAWTANIRQERIVSPSTQDVAVAAEAVLAGEVRAREVEILAQEVGQRAPRLDLALVRRR